MTPATTATAAKPKSWADLLKEYGDAAATPLGQWLIKLIVVLGGTWIAFSYDGTFKFI
jgi:hypothetical protein